MTSKVERIYKINTKKKHGSQKADNCLILRSLYPAILSQSSK